MSEQIFGKGAIITPPIAKMPTLARSSIPFDWSKIFSTRELVTKNQDGSGSCGGQAVSYKGEADDGIPKSARFPYAQVFVNIPGGGSGELDLIKIVVTEGLTDESLFTSYDNGNPPSEDFMRKNNDITPIVLLNARGRQGVPVYVYLDFESIAQAIRDNNGIIIGIYGANNGTWLSVNPQAPEHIYGCWAHWLFVGKAGMYNGKKAICVKNSWGNVGDNGWQWLTEDYLPYIFSAWTFVKGNGYKFNSNMYFGKSGEDIFALQARLGIKPTGWFGPMTLANVISYQKANGIPATGFVGPLTRGKLNTS